MYEDQSLLLLTDWGVESLSPSVDKVMPIGYDSLELALLAPRLLSGCPSSPARVLDLCCGSGVQSLVAAATYRLPEAGTSKDCGISPPESSGSKASKASKVSRRGSSPEVAVWAVDINDRAVHTTCFNGILNGFSARILDVTPVDDLTALVWDITVLLGDCYDPFIDSTFTSTGTTSGAASLFHVVLANPPFVAVPPAPDFPPGEVGIEEPHVLFADGGPDGTRVLARIVSGAGAILRPGGRLVCVTEMPNVNKADQWLGCRLPPNAVGAVAFVREDVQPRARYAAHRALDRTQFGSESRITAACETESGCTLLGALAKRWIQCLDTHGVEDMVSSCLICVEFTAIAGSTGEGASATVSIEALSCTDNGSSSPTCAAPAPGSRLLSSELAGHVTSVFDALVTRR